MIAGTAIIKPTFKAAPTTISTKRRGIEITAITNISNGIKIIAINGIAKTKTPKVIKSPKTSRKKLADFSSQIRKLFIC